MVCVHLLLLYISVFVINSFFLYSTSYLYFESSGFVFTRQKKQNNTCVSSTLTHTLKCPDIFKHTHTSCQSRGVMGRGSGVTRRLYVRLRVWKILDIWSMTGPVSGSFIHWVLFSGFSSISSNASRVLGLVSPSCTTGFSRMA